jgi:hypothetical protein
MRGNSREPVLIASDSWLIRARKRGSLAWRMTEASVDLAGILVNPEAPARLRAARAYGA